MKRYLPFLFLLLICGLPALGDEKEDPKSADPVNEGKEILKQVQDGVRELLVPRGNGFGRRGNHFRGVRPMAPGQSPDSEDSAGSRDSIDNRAPHDAKIEQILKASKTAIQQKNWKATVELLQRLLDQPEDSLHRSENGQWQSIRRTANRMLGSLPEVTLAEYRSQYGGLAQQQLAAARRSGQTADFVNVATRFFHTPAGYEAANYLASLHFDRSEFGLASRWFEELAGSPSALARFDPWLMQAATAFARVGDTKGANALLERLSRGPTTTVTLGTRQVKASEWLSQLQGETSILPAALSDWTQLYGTAARVGTAVGGDPLLSPTWSLPLTSSHTVRNSLKWLVQDLRDQQRALILASVPLVADGRVIYRDLRGVRSVDIDRGHPIWESVEGTSPERILGGLPPQQVDPQEAWRFRMNPFQHLGDYQGGSAEYSPLTNLLFRDGTYGLISSDGKQIFSIEEHGILSRNQPGQHWGWDGNPEPHDPFGLPWKTNRLVSYDLQTGRQLWCLGGSELKEPFDLPLAGAYFYGTPAVDGDDLFVVAGKGDEVRLWSLERGTGIPQWTQLIAYSDTKIDVDIARRWVTSQVAVGNGVIICPTTVGWLVAVDRMQRSVLWAHRYTSRSSVNNSEREPGSQFVPQKELNATWSPSAPVIAGSYVVYTPQEEPILICLNAVDGRRLWEHPKERGLYLAGVFDGKVVVVGETGVTAFQLENGKAAWNVPFDEGVRPSGRGVAVDDRIYLPLSNGELRTIELGTGKLLSQTFVASQQPPLGNLAMHRGKLVSLGPSGLTAFGQRDALIADIRRRLAENPEDPWGLLMSSEIFLLNHQYTEALPLLRRIARDQLTPEERVRQHAVFVECLATLVHNDVLNRGNELDELRQLAESSSEKLMFRELSAEKLLAEHKPVEAFEVLSKLADQAGDSVLARTDNRHITSKHLVWLSGRMLDIWTDSTETDQQSINDRVRSLAEAAANQSSEACQRAATLYAFHPASAVAKRRLVEWLFEAKDLAGARLVLLVLADNSDPNIAANAIERLAQMMVASHLPDDAVHYYQLLESRFAGTKVHDGLTGAELVARVREKGDLVFAPRTHGISWPQTSLRTVQSAMNYSQPSQEVTVDSSLPYFYRFSLDAHQAEQRLSFEAALTGEVDWMAPLKGALHGTDDGVLIVQNIGHQLFFVNRGILHAISPIEKRIIWSKALDEHDDGTMVGRHSNRSPFPPMSGPGLNEGSQSLLVQQSFAKGRLAVVQPNYLCVYGRRSLSILNPRTGEELWQLDGLPTNAQVVGNRDALFAIIPGRDEVLVYRAIDGKPLNVRGVSSVLNNALLTCGPAFLVLEQDSANPLSLFGLKRPKSTLRLYNPLRHETIWRQEYPADALISPMGEDEVVVAGFDGKVQRIDVATGRVIPLEAIPGLKMAASRKKYLLFDEDRIYLISNRNHNENQSFSENLTSVPLNGTVYAWNRHDNRFLWQRSVQHQNLVVDRFAKLPILLCVSRPWKPQNGMMTLNIAAIHKESGAQLIPNPQIPSIYLGFNAVGINLNEPSIELKSINMRMRLVPTDVPVAADTEVAPSPPKNPPE